MGFLDFTTAIFLLAIGAVVFYALGRILISQVWRLFRSNRQAGRFGKARLGLEKADQLIQNGEHENALRELEKSAVYVEVVSVEEVRILRDHHQNLLSRCLVLAEAMESRLRNIAEVERLLIERNELLILKLKADEAFSSLRQKRQTKGKTTPSWSRSEYEKRKISISDQLKSNQNSLEREFAVLFESMRSPDNRSDIVYH